MASAQLDGSDITLYEHTRSYQQVIVDLSDVVLTQQRAVKRLPKHNDHFHSLHIVHVYYDRYTGRKAESDT